MRARAIFLWSCICVLPAAVIQVACGGEDDGGAAKPDSGTPAPAADAAGDAPTTTPGDDDDDDDNDNCDKTADFTKNIPDASIADGASSTGACIGCANAKCATQVKACNENCICQDVADDALPCILQNAGNPIACLDVLGDAITDKPAQNAALGIFQCVSAQCEEECALDELLPSDAGDGG